MCDPDEGSRVDDVTNLPMQPVEGRYKLMGADRTIFASPVKGTFGGYRVRRIYGRLDCAGAAWQIAKGHYVKHRVFFADEATAIAAGYRPCGTCMKTEYAAWKKATAP